MGLRDTVAKRRAERAKPKSLAELKERKRLADLKEQPKPKSLAELKKAKQREASKQHDFSVAGVKYHNVQRVDGYWTIDMTNGDKTYTLNNRHGAWYHDIEHGNGRMAEPVRVGRALGIADSQLDISQTLQLRLDRELRARGIPTPDQLLRQREEEAKQHRRKQRKTDDD